MATENYRLVADSLNCDFVITNVYGDHIARPLTQKSFSSANWDNKNLSPNDLWESVTTEDERDAIRLMTKAPQLLAAVTKAAALQPGQPMPADILTQLQRAVESCSAAPQASAEEPPKLHPRQIEIDALLAQRGLKMEHSLAALVPGEMHALMDIEMDECIDPPDDETALLAFEWSMYSGVVPEDTADEIMAESFGFRQVDGAWVAPAPAPAPAFKPETKIEMPGEMPEGFFYGAVRCLPDSCSVVVADGAVFVPIGNIPSVGPVDYAVRATPAAYVKMCQMPADFQVRSGTRFRANDNGQTPIAEMTLDQLGAEQVFNEWEIAASQPFKPNTTTREAWYAANGGFGGLPAHTHSLGVLYDMRLALEQELAARDPQQTHEIPSAVRVCRDLSPDI